MKLLNRTLFLFYLKPGTVEWNFPSWSQNTASFVSEVECKCLLLLFLLRSFLLWRSLVYESGMCKTLTRASSLNHSCHSQIICEAFCKKLFPSVLDDLGDTYFLLSFVYCFFRKAEIDKPCFLSQGEKRHFSLTQFAG